MRAAVVGGGYTLKGKYSLAFLARGGLHHTMGGRAYTRTLEHVHDTYTYTDTDTYTAEAAAAPAGRGRRRRKGEKSCGRE